MPAEAPTVEIDAQYRAMRDAAGLLEPADRRLLAVHGPEAAEYLQGQLTNDIEALEPGQGCYAAQLDRKGRMQADARVLRISPGEIWLESEEVGAPALARHLATYRVGRKVEVEDLGDRRSTLSLIGPAAAEIAGTGALAPEHAHEEVEVAGIGVRGVAAHLGIDLICATPDAEAMRAALLERGAVAVDGPAAEILRVESGRPRFGREMSTETIPAEAGINDRAVSFTKGCYIGQETVARLHYKGKPNRHLRGLRLSSATARGEGLRLGEREVGRIGTATVSPSLGPIALAIVRREAEPGATLEVGGEGVTAEVIELPFRA